MLQYAPLKSGVIVSGIILVIAVLALASLTYTIVPASIIQTLTLESTETLTSYSPYVASDIITYTTTTVGGPSKTGFIGLEPSCFGISEPPYYPCTGVTVTLYSQTTQTFESTYETQRTANIPYSQTETTSTTASSTTLVPALEALGLTDGSFSVLAILVIGSLALVTAWLALKPGTRTRK